ncbi:unnamed protein product [Trifolium pratense]|uniref:Uncharacterized protein n=1 Tax=Trifolium pratense TaxID=57577 RepID=A0ACB0J9S8_TRIPR|nr:unnamed protein product [Trifolium pratense]
MLSEGSFNLNRITFSTLLILASKRGCVQLGRQIHGHVVKFGFMYYVFVGSPLVDMYSKMGMISCARQAFDEFPEKNVVMYNTLITGLMRCGKLEDSKRLFLDMRERDSISWTSMITGFTQNGLDRDAIDFFQRDDTGKSTDGSVYVWKCFNRLRGEEAVKTFSDMQKYGIEPDDFTLGSVISSCANLASIEEGAQFHARALISGLILFITVSNALVTLYGKCGSIEDSHRFFREMRFKDEVTSTALVSGYAKFGKANETIRLFESMLAYGLKPDKVTFIGVLSACSRAGLVEKGNQIFESMIMEHRIVPIQDHYTCMIDLFSRAGRLEEVRNFINKMPFRPDAIGWSTLLSSCRFYGNMDIGKWAAEFLMRERDSISNQPSF